MPLAEALAAFRATHPLRTLIVAGIPWEYRVSGTGHDAVLMIHGGTGSSESIFRYTLALEGDHRVITPTVPTAVTTMGDVLTGIQAILEVEQVAIMHCVGFSMGGMIAQVFLRQHPERVRSLFLFHCPPPGAAYADRLERHPHRLRWLPRRLTRLLVRAYLAKEFRRYAYVPGDERRFWVRYYLDASSAERTANQLKIVCDYLRNHEFAASDLAHWHGAVAIVETATDRVIPAGDRTRLKALYPRARVHTFPSGGHLGNGLFRIDTTIALMHELLARPRAG